MSTITFDLCRDPREKTGLKTKALHLHIIIIIIIIISNFISIGESNVRGHSHPSHTSQQVPDKSIASSYWSLLNFLAPAGLLKMKKRI